MRSYTLLSTHPRVLSFVTFGLDFPPLWCFYKWHHMVYVNEWQITRLDTLGRSKWAQHQDAFL